MKQRTTGRPLSLRQQEVYDFLCEFFDANDQLPPMKAICKHMGWASDNRANEVLEILNDKGWIEKNAVGKYRFKRERAAALRDANWPPVVTMAA